MANVNDKISLGALSTSVDTNRYAGGSKSTSGDHPFIKGYFYVFFGLPGTLFNDNEAATAEKFLLVSSEAYTPPGDRQMNIQDVQGQGGVDSSYITGQTISREFSIQYKDYWGAPIFRIHRMWTNYINPYLGVVSQGENIKFESSEYKGVCMVIQTKPVKKEVYTKDDIIKIDLFDGVQPMTDLKSVYDANITDNSFVKPSVQYKFDGFPLDETNADVVAKAEALLNSSDQLFKNTEDIYSKLISENI